jgi:hypothetical protein
MGPEYILESLISYPSTRIVGDGYGTHIQFHNQTEYISTIYTFGNTTYIPNLIP